MKRHDNFFVYMIQDKNGTYYTGSTNHLERRFKLHQSGKGAKYLRGRGPVKLVYVKRHRSRGNALRAEAKIKTLTRERKMSMIEIYRSRGAPPTDFFRQKTAEKNQSVGVTSESPKNA